MPALNFDQLDPSIQRLAIRNEAAVKKAAQVVTHTKAAELLGLSKSTQSDWCTEHLQRCCQSLAAYGLKLVPRDEETISKDLINAYKLLARREMDREEPVTDYGALDER